MCRRNTDEKLYRVFLLERFYQIYFHPRLCYGPLWTLTTLLLTPQSVVKGYIPTVDRTPYTFGLYSAYYELLISRRSVNRIFV